jgi:KDO2-lipid IV(A) lauroyltransferase
MKKIKYFLQFICVIFFFVIFKILGLKLASIISSNIFILFGPIFRSNKIVFSNLKIAFPDIDENQKKQILKKMWFNYGKIFAEYMFIKDFRHNEKYSAKISIENKDIIEKIIKDNEQVIFISGHFNNFELMAMQIEKLGIKLTALYRPLNNPYLNPIMEKIRKKYICKKQVKKGISGTKDLLLDFKDGSSIALMIDQRVSQGIRSNLFNKEALTTTIPAQFIKKFKIRIVPVHVERQRDNDFKIKFFEPVNFSNEESIETITFKLNKILEEMIIKSPEQWIWTHNRWK